MKLKKKNISSPYLTAKLTWKHELNVSRKLKSNLVLVSREVSIRSGIASSVTG